MTGFVAVEFSAVLGEWAALDGVVHSSVLDSGRGGTEVWYPRGRDV